MSVKYKGFYFTFVLLFCFVGSIFSQVRDSKVKLVSPSGISNVEVNSQSGKLVCNISYNNYSLFQDSELGLFGAMSRSNVSDGFIITQRTVSEEWSPLYGQFSSISNEFNEYVLEFDAKKKIGGVLQVIFRIYDDGVAFRYHLPKLNPEKKVPIRELTSFTPVSHHQFFSYQVENDPAGPFSLDTGQISNAKLLQPLVFEFFDDSGHVQAAAAIQEAGIYQYSPFSLQNSKDKLKVVSVKNNQLFSPYFSSWRVVKMAENAGSLVESRLLENLNPPSKIADTSWIKPGQSMWDWRVWGYQTEDGFTYGLNTNSHLRFVDFAAENGIEYLLLDADWYGPEFSGSSDPTSGNGEVRIEELMKYAKIKGIGIILYLNDVGAKEFGMERVIKQFSDWGAAGVKYGFMNDSGQQKVLWTRKVVETCAKYHLTVNFHDNPIAPSGDSRTWPNLMSREFGYAQADARRVRDPHNAVWMVYLNMLAGELDLTYGWYGHGNAHEEGRPRVFEAIPGTVVGENAKVVLLNSGISVLPDAPEEYLKKADLFELIQNLPNSYDETLFIDGAIGEWIALAKRKNNQWYLAVITDEQARNIKIDTALLAHKIYGGKRIGANRGQESFANRNSSWNATFYVDGDNAHYLTNKESYRIYKAPIKQGEVLELNLAAGGGAVVVFDVLPLQN